MSRFVTALVVVAIVLLPATAQAQETNLRDPFDPLLTTETDTDGTTDTTGDTTGTTDTTTDTDTDTDTDTAPTDGLPTTGADPRSWLAVAYVLLAVGVGMLGYARFNRGPQRAR